MACARALRVPASKQATCRVQMQTVVPCTDITEGQQVSRQVDHIDTLKWLP